jgi:hypothetical protein
VTVNAVVSLRKEGQPGISEIHRAEKEAFAGLIRFIS